MLIFGKTLKNLLLQKQESFGVESRYIVSYRELKIYPIYSNDDRRMTFDYLFMTSHMCVRIHLYGGKVEKHILSQNVLQTNT